MIKTPLDTDGLNTTSMEADAKQRGLRLTTQPGDAGASPFILQVVLGVTARAPARPTKETSNATAVALWA
jgi:hypothetical protein